MFNGMKRCVHCERLYYPSRSDQMYCCKGCRLREYRESAKEVRAGLREEKQKYGIKM